MPKKIIISFDGTWNTPDVKSEIKGSKSTNVWKLHASILASDKNGTTQEKWYDKGIWGTVGALGIPLESFNWFNKAYYEFHDTELSSIVHNAFHAVAIDEWRKNYQCTLWDPTSKPNQRVEQVWFSGAHANIGGGYADNNSLTLPWSG